MVQVSLREMAYSSEAIAVYDDWRQSDKLCHRAASMCVAQIGKKEDIDRREVAENCEILMPIIKHIGFLI